LIYSSPVDSESNNTIKLSKCTFDDCKPFIGKNDFTSKEELLQLFYNAYYTNSLRNVIMNGPDLKLLNKSINTMFPLNNCLSITSVDNRLILDFKKPQSVTIPGTFHQAHLNLSKKVIFELQSDSIRPMILRFKIIDGYVNIRTSGISRIFNASFDNIDGKELFYYCDDKNKHSVLGLEEHTLLPKEILKITGDISHIKIKIEPMKTEMEHDIEIKKNYLKFFSTEFTLSNNDSLKVNDENWQKDSLTVDKINSMIDTLQTAYTNNQLLINGMIINKSAVYELEKQTISISKGFSENK
jgi:hypothetical protein